MPRTFSQEIIKKLTTLAPQITAEEFETTWAKLPYVFGKLNPVSRSYDSSHNLTWDEQYKRRTAVGIFAVEAAVCFIPYVGVPIGFADMYRRFYSAQYVEKRIGKVNGRKCDVDRKVREQKLNYADTVQLFLQSEGNENLASAKYTFICMLLAFKNISEQDLSQDSATLFAQIDIIHKKFHEEHFTPEIVVALVMKRDPRGRFAAITIENLQAAIIQTCEAYINQRRSILDTTITYFGRDDLQQRRAHKLAQRLPGFVAQTGKPFGQFHFDTLLKDHNNDPLQILLFLLTTEEGQTNADSFKALLLAHLGSIENFHMVAYEPANSVNHVVGDLIKELYTREVFAAAVSPAPVDSPCTAATNSTVTNS